MLREHGCGIAPNTYWTAKKRQPSKRSMRDAELVEHIQRVYDENLAVYGADKIWAQLNDEGIRVARCTVERLMRRIGLRGAVRGRAFRITTTPATVAERPLDLVARNFTATRPNQLWVADLTYIATWRGFVYAAFVVDVFSRRIVGWSMSSQMTAQLVTDALVMAIWRRGKPQQLLHHSDQGSQYSSEQFQRLLAEQGITCSMSRQGDVWDNAAIESFFSSLKTERVNGKVYSTRNQARADVFDYVESQPVVARLNAALDGAWDARPGREGPRG